MSMTQREYEARSVYALERIADALERLADAVTVPADAPAEGCAGCGADCGC